MSSDEVHTKEYVQENAAMLASKFFTLKELFDDEKLDLVIMIFLSFICTKLSEQKSMKLKTASNLLIFHLFQNFIRREIIPYLAENDEDFKEAYKEYMEKRDKVLKDEE